MNSKNGKKELKPIEVKIDIVYMKAKVEVVYSSEDFKILQEMDITKRDKHVNEAILWHINQKYKNPVINKITQNGQPTGKNLPFNQKKMVFSVILMGKLKEK